MDVTPLVRQGSKIIQSYADGKFRISGEIFEGGVVVSPESVSLWQSPPHISGIAEDHFLALANMLEDFDIILMGTGPRLVFPTISVRAALKARRLNFDFMDTGAASRTYNVLMAEGRKVSAILMPFSAAGAPL